MGVDALHNANDQVGGKHRASPRGDHHITGLNGHIVIEEFDERPAGAFPKEQAMAFAALELDAHTARGIGQQLHPGGARSHAADAAQHTARAGDDRTGFDALHPTSAQFQLLPPTFNAAADHRSGDPIPGLIAQRLILLKASQAALKSGNALLIFQLLGLFEPFRLG